MTAVISLPSPPADIRRWRSALLDGWTIMRRDIAHLRYTPSELAAELIFPAVMVILFGYVFGSAIRIPGGANYRAYLMPGLFAFSQVTAIGVIALGTADDAARGVMDRFRSMPMARSAVAFGRTGASIATGILNLTVLSICGLIVGWRVNRGLLDAAAAFGLLLLTRYALSWLGAYLGLLVKNPTTADNLVPLSFPIAMLSNTFVPTGDLPVWLRYIAEWNPVSCLVGACRDLFGNPAAVSLHTSWALEHPVVATLVWAIVLICVFAPLATRRYATAHL
jgi:ABC-2 type transport system permease protein